MSYWQAGAAAGGAVLGGLNSGSNTEHIGTDELFGDWMQQDVIDLASNIPNLQPQQYFPDSTVAPQNPMMEQSIQDQFGFGQEGGAGYDAQQQMNQQGSNLMGAYDQGLDYLNNMNERGPNQFQYDQGTYDQSFGNLSGGMQNQFDLGARNIQQGFDWNMLPGLNMQNAMGGGGGNTKFGQQGALGQAMANQNIQQMGTDLWQTAAFGADRNAMNAGGQNLSSANNFDQNMLANYGMYGDAGTGMMQTGYDMGKSNMGLAQNAAGIQQGYDQSLVDADVQRHNFEQNEPWNRQQNMQNLTNQWRNNASFQDSGMSLLEGAFNGAQAGAGIYNAFAPVFNQGGGGNYANGGFGNAPANSGGGTVYNPQTDPVQQGPGGTYDYQPLIW